MNEVVFTNNSITFKFIDTPGLNNAKGNEQNKNEIKKAASEYHNFKCILFLLSFQDDRIKESTINTLQKYMEIFPLHYFWENVIVVYTKVYSGEDDEEIGDIIEERRGKFIESLTKKKDFENFKKFMKDNKIKCPSSIYEYLVNSKKKLKNIDALTKSEYQKILIK